MTPKLFLFYIMTYKHQKEDNTIFINEELQIKNFQFNIKIMYYIELGM